MKFGSVIAGDAIVPFELRLKVSFPFYTVSISIRTGNITYIKIFHSPLRDEVVGLVLGELHFRNLLLWIALSIATGNSERRDVSFLAL
jgi:hypothetical protein